MNGRRYRSFVDFVLRVERVDASSTSARQGHVPVRVEASDLYEQVWEGHGEVCIDASMRTGGKKWQSRDGKALLPAGPVLEAFHASVQAAEASGLLLRVCLDVQDPALADVAWERALVPHSPGGPPLLAGPPTLARYRGVLLVRRVAGAFVRPDGPHPEDLTGTLLLGSALKVRGELVCPDGRREKIKPLEGADVDASVVAHPVATGTPRTVRALEYPLTTSALCSALRAPVWCFAFQGHGLRDGLVLAGPDGISPEFLGAGDLAEALTRAGAAVTLLLACETAAPGHGSMDANLAESLVRAGVPYVIAMRTPIKNIDANRMAGDFFDEFARSGSVDLAVIRIREMAADGEWLPSVYVAAEAPRHFPLRARDLSERELQGLAAYHVPLDWRPGEVRPLVGDAHPARIDVLWGLDRGPLRGVLVAPEPDADIMLARLLRHVEEYVLWDGQDYVLKDELPTRRWFPVRHDWEDPPEDPYSLMHLLKDHRELAWYLEEGPGAPNAGSPGYGRRVGLVLPYELTGGVREPEEVAAFSRRFAVAFPGAALIVCVKGLPSGADRLSRLVGDLARAWPTLAWLSRTVPGRLPPGAAAWAGGTSWHGDGAFTRGDWRAASTALLARAAALPRHDFEQLLVRAARDEDLAIRAAALVVASSRYAELDVLCNAWARDEWPPDPGRLGLREHGDAIVCGLLRGCREPAEAAAVLRNWERFVSDEVAGAAGHLATTGPGACAAADLAYLAGCRTAADVTAALRAGIGAELSLRSLLDPPSDRLPLPLRSPVVWALLARSPLSRETAGLLRTWTPALRRVLGFASDRESDPEVREALEPLHRILHPCIPPPH
ncbi:CHAT domain-containing protein [Streptomyces cellulosae]